MAICKSFSSQYSCILFDGIRARNIIFCSNKAITNVQHSVFPIRFVMVNSCILESRPSYTRDAVGDGDGGEVGASTESITSNARYAVGDNRVLTTSNQCISCRFNNRIAVVAAIVCSIAFFNYHGGEGGARTESSISNARYAIGDSEGGEGGAITESITSNARNAVGDNRVLTTSNKGISSGFDNRITVVAAIVGSITFFYYHRGKGGATRESMLSNARDAIRDGDGGEGEAIPESITSNARYAVRDSDRGEGGAIFESRTSNARYAVDNTIVGDGFGNSHFARIFARVFIIRTSPVSYFDVVSVEDVVIDAIGFKVFCPEGESGDECHE